MTVPFFFLSSTAILQEISKPNLLHVFPSAAADGTPADRASLISELFLFLSIFIHSSLSFLSFTFYSLKKKYIYIYCACFFFSFTTISQEISRPNLPFLPPPQMGPQLIGRVSDLDLTWDKELASSSTRLSPYIDLDIEHKNALRAVNAFNFVQMKRESKRNVW